MKKMKYEAPTVNEELVIELEHEILGASVVTENTEVETTGQEYVEMDLTGDEFYHNWK